MEIRLLKQSDCEQIKKWLPSHLHNDALPAHTFVAVYEDTVVAFAGLRLAEGPMCFIDSMATNAIAPRPVRHEALDSLTELICKTAKDLGFKTILATTKEESIVNRAARHGFVVVPQTLIAKEL